MQSMTVVRALTALWSQRPSLPARSLIDRSRVDRRRHHGVPVTWIDSADAAEATLVHLHGGAYLHGERPAHWDWLEEVTRRADTAGAMVHYRMPPRFPFPAPYDDTMEALRDLIDSAVVRPGRWVLSGDSAGAGLALAVAQALRDEGVPPPALLLLTSPWADLTGDQHGDPELRRAARLYTGPVPAEDPRISPVLGDLADLPPVHLVAGGGDALLSDGQRLRQRFEEAGTEVEYVEAPGQVHNYPITESGAHPQAARRSQIAAMRRALGADPAFGTDPVLGVDPDHDPEPIPEAGPAAG